MKKIIQTLCALLLVFQAGCEPEPNPEPPPVDVPDVTTDTTDTTDIIDTTDTSVIATACGSGPSCPADMICDEARGQCVGCLEDGDCSKGVCHPVEQVCVTCYEDSDCTSGRCHPLAAICVQCLEDDDCIEGVCDGQSLMCIGCLEDADCESGICNTVTRSCVGCASDDTCADDDPCTKDACEGGECTYTTLPDGEICDDEDPCTIEETCVAGVCSSYLTAPACCEPVTCDGNHTLTDTDGDGCDDACAQSECLVDDVCDKAGYCFFTPGACGEVMGLCVKTPNACKEQEAPVCGCDGVTYGSACLAAMQKVSVAYEAPCEVECEELICPEDAKAADLDGDDCPDTCMCPDDTPTTSDTPCSEEDKCTTTKGCPEGFFCAKPEGLCEAIGACKKAPIGCEDLGDPVCACDGKFYESECIANQLGQTVAPKALCDQGG